jgi:DNA-binding HxlR family transcriptional regulator
MLIIYHAPQRFGELRRLLPGISEKMLIPDLRQMQEINLLVRKNYQQVPHKVEYFITAFGRSLGRSLAPLCAWGERNRKHVLGKKPIIDTQKRAMSIDFGPMSFHISVSRLNGN